MEQIDLGTMGLKASLRNNFSLIIVYDNQNFAFLFIYFLKWSNIIKNTVNVIAARGFFYLTFWIKAPIPVQSIMMLRQYDI